MTDLLSALSAAERTYDGPIPHRETILAGGADRLALKYARGSLDYHNSLVRDSIEALRRLRGRAGVSDWRGSCLRDMALHNRERRLLRVEVELLSARIVCAETQRRAA